MKNKSLVATGLLLFAVLVVASVTAHCQARLVDDPNGSTNAFAAPELAPSPPSEKSAVSTAPEKNTACKKHGRCHREGKHARHAKHNQRERKLRDRLASLRESRPKSVGGARVCNDDKSLGGAKVEALPECPPARKSLRERLVCFVDRLQHARDHKEKCRDA